MRALTLKPDHKLIAAYHQSLANFDNLGVEHEGAVGAALQALLLAGSKTAEECTAYCHEKRENSLTFFR